MYKENPFKSKIYKKGVVGGFKVKHVNNEGAPFSFVGKPLAAYPNTVLI